MTTHRVDLANGSMILLPDILAAFIAALFLSTASQATELPPEQPLWDNLPADYVNRQDVQEQVRSATPRPDSPSGMHRAFSLVSSPTYSIHRPESPNGVGLVICPGGGFRDVWIDFEGHDLAIWLKDHGVTSLVLKYRTRLDNGDLQPNEWHDYQRAVQADGTQAIRVLRQKASDLGLHANKIGISGFSAGGHLAICCSLRAEPKLPERDISGIPDFAGLFYPGIPDDIDQLMDSLATAAGRTSTICPMFIVNARVDKLTPVEECIDFYTMLLKRGVNAELHVFSTGSHGFGMGQGRGKSTALWPTSFVAWLRDSNIIENQ